MFFNPRKEVKNPENFKVLFHGGLFVSFVFFIACYGQELAL
jgi:hypothetical protein